MKCQMNVYLRHVLYKIIIPFPLLYYIKKCFAGSRYGKAIIGTFVIFNLSFVILPFPTFAQDSPTPIWATYGLLLNDTPGNTPQQNPQIVSDGQGNFILVWEDGRSGYYDIYAQKINGAGTLLWASSGVAVCRFAGNQNLPKMVSDGAGGAIITWQDYRDGNADIYAQRIGPNGQIYWGNGGKAVCAAPVGQFAPELITDEKNGAFITWHDYRSKKGEDIYAQRISSRGSPLWEENGIPISMAKGTQWYPKIASDKTGGAIITWTDGRISSSNNDIYAQRITPSGKKLWEKNGKQICAAPNNQERPIIISSQNGPIIAWNDFRSGNIDIYAQKVGLDGKLTWDDNGIPVCSASFTQENPKLSSDGEGGAIFVWSDERVEANDIYAQRIFQDGSPAWQENGRAVCKTDGSQKNPKIINLKNGNWVIAWEDTRQKSTDIFSQKINSDGTALWGKNGQLVAQAPHAQDSITIASTASGNIIAAWQDRRFGNYDIYAQKITSEGNITWGKSGSVICDTNGSVVQQKAELIDNGKEEIILVFEDARSGFFNIYAQKVDKYGQLAWGKDGLPIAKVSASQTNPNIVSDGKGGAFISWEDHRTPNFPTVRIQRINSLGQKIWESSLSAAQSKSQQVNPVMVSDNANGAIIAWQDNRNALDLQDIYVQRVSPSGKLLWGIAGKNIIPFSGDQTKLDMIADGSGGAFLAWTDSRDGERNPDIYSQRINANGLRLWKEEGILICGAPDIQHSPKLARNGSGDVVIAWTDKGGGSYDIYAQRVSESGQALWITDGIPINQLSRTQQNPKFGSKKVLVWEDYRYGNWDIFAGTVNSSGKLTWGEKGVPVVSFSRTQYAPQIIQWKDGGIIIVWEDYRSEEYYETYIQKIDIDGNPAWQENGIKIQSRDGGRSPKILASYSDDSFYILWEDYTDGGRSIYGQKFLVN